ncbi:hypothetical protein [Microbacterium sp.]|uniref:hypothetical protein n=1 Tax=Microbacterium sp. TaxID=51671 RepID=UPI003C78C3F7
MLTAGCRESSVSLIKPDGSGARVITGELKSKVDRVVDGLRLGVFDSSLRWSLNARGTRPDA